MLEQKVRVHPSPTPAPTGDVLPEASAASSAAPVIEGSTASAAAEQGGPPVSAGPEAATAATTVTTVLEGFKVDDKVDGQFGGRNGHKKWFKATISAVHADGTYDLVYDDGDKESRVAAQYIKKHGAPAPSTSTSTTPTNTTVPVDSAPPSTPPPSQGMAFVMDQKVEVRFRGGKKYFKAVITGVHGSGAFYDVRYDDGDKEQGVAPTLIRAVDGAAPAAAAAAASSPTAPAPSSSASYEVGDKVEARYKSGTRWFPGKIAAVNRDGTYDIRYDDGDKESDVASSCVRPVGGGQSAEERARLEAGDWRAGDAVWVKHVASGLWFEATVKEVGAEVVAVVYRDGSNDEGLPRANLSFKGQANKLTEGLEVKVLYEGRRWYDASILGAPIGPSEPTYRVRLSDGERKRVAAKDIVLASEWKSSPEAAAPIPRPPRGGPYHPGDQVEARLLDTAASWELARVLEVHDAGSWYSLRLLKSEVLQQLGAPYLRLPDDDPSAPLFKAGDRVSRTWSRGQSVSSGGATILSTSPYPGEGLLKYKVLLDDVSTVVEAVSSSELSPLVLSVGTKCRVWDELLPGLRRVISGEVVSKTGDTYDVKVVEAGRLPDEDFIVKKGLGVASILVPEQTGSLSGLIKPYRDGSAVERRVGDGKWIRGKVVGKSQNGSYNIMYPSIEAGVPATDLRLAEALSYPRHTEVLVKFNNGSRIKLFKAVITGRGEEHYDVQYLEGDKEEERGVPFDALVPSPSFIGPSTVLLAGQKVEIFDGEDTPWVQATVLEPGTDRGQYTVVYDDSGRKAQVDIEQMRLVLPAVEEGSAASANAYEIGQKVEARFRGRNKWFPAKIMAIPSVGRYDIRYDDGDRESDVSEDLIRAVGDSAASRLPATRSTPASPTDSAAASKYCVGQKVEAMYRGLPGRWCRATVAQVLPDESYVLDYAGEGREFGVSSGLISTVYEFRRGQPVDVKEHEDGSWERAKLASIEVKEDQEAQYSYIRVDGFFKLRKVVYGLRASFAAGEAVRVRGQDGTTWRDGRISGVGEGIYDVVITETNEQLVQVSWRNITPAASEAAPFQPLFKVGDSVDVALDDSTTWRRCTISEVDLPSETYDVFLEYEDDKERGILEAQLRPAYDPDAEVQVYIHSGPWVTAVAVDTIRSAMVAGFRYLVKLEGKELPELVPATAIKLPGQRTCSEGLVVDAKVYARNEEDQWDAARIKAVLDNGTFEVEFADGNHECKTLAAGYIAPFVESGQPLEIQSGVWVPGKVVDKLKNRYKIGYNVKLASDESTGAYLPLELRPVGASA